MAKLILLRGGSICLRTEDGLTSCPCQPSSTWRHGDEEHRELTAADVPELLRREKEARARGLPHEARVARAAAQMLKM